MLRYIRRSGPSEKQVCNQSRHLPVLTAGINDHGRLSWSNFFNNNLRSSPLFFLLLLLPLWELKVRFTYLSICYYADHGNIFTRMPLDNSVKQLGRLCTLPKKFAIQNNSYLSSGNCCRQIRLTLNMYFCAFGDILWACLYNLVFTCKQ